MWKKNILIIIGLVIGLIGIIYYALQYAFITSRPVAPQNVEIQQPSTKPVAVPAEPGGGGRVPTVPTAPVKSESPVPAGTFVPVKKGQEKSSERVTPTPVPVGIPATPTPPAGK